MQTEARLAHRKQINEGGMLVKSSNMRTSGIDRYSTFGLRDEWVDVFFNNGNDWFGSYPNLGSKMIPAAINWLREAEMIDDKEKKITWRLLRATMKQAEEAVSACPFIIRCHRAFLVNIRMVVKVDGNSQGYKLNLEGCEEEVPVSRAYAKEVKALIENRTKS